MDPITPFLSKAFRYLSYRPRSEKEIRDYLLGKNRPKRKNIKFRHSGLSRIDSGVSAGWRIPQNDNTSEIIDAVISRLKEMKFLDDAEFAQNWVRSRTEYKPKAVSIIKMELRQKGISTELIEQALRSRVEGKSDNVLALELLKKRKKRYEGMERNERLQKAGGFLARKGFSFEVIKSVIDEIFS